MIGSRLNRIRYESQQQNLTKITKHISGLKLEQTSATITPVSNISSVVNDHTNAPRGEASRICQTTQNPVKRFDFALSADRAVQDVTNNLSADKSKISWPLANPELDSSALSFPNEKLRRSRQQTWTKRHTVICYANISWYDHHHHHHHYHFHKITLIEIKNH